MRKKLLTVILAACIPALTLAETLGRCGMRAEASANDIAGEDDVLEEEQALEEQDSFWEADRAALSGEIGRALQGAGSRNIVVTAGKKIHVSGDTVRDLAGKSVTLAMQTGYSLTFSISGTDIGSAGEDLWIRLMTREAIPYEAKAAVLQRSDASFEFGMEDKERYPFRVNVHMNFGAENAGKTAILYYYDENSGTLQYAGAFRATGSGDVMFGLNRGDEYLAVIADRNACTVVSGDTLSGIAARRGISLKNLLSANPQVRDSNIIYPGQSIVIP